MNPSPVGGVGLSHLGVVYSAGLASLGFHVLGMDVDKNAVSRLQRGDCVFPEPLLPGLMRLHGCNMDFTSDVARLAVCDTVVIAEDSGMTEDYRTDVSRILSLVDSVIPHLKPGVSILLTSQVPVGFPRDLRGRIHRQREALPFHLSYWMETVVIGDAVERFLKPDRIIIGFESVPNGLSHQAEKLLRSFGCPVLFMNYESAVLTKMAVNFFLASTVTFANELSNVCEAAGADMAHVIPALRLDKRIGPSAYIKPGLGFSGGHFERDLVSLSCCARSFGLGSPLLDLIRKESADRYRWLTRKIDSMIFARNPSPRIALWGLSYKKNTDSTRGAPSLRVIRDYADRARIVVHDPVVKLAADLRVAAVDDRYDALEGADALLILSDWDVFKDLDVERLKSAMKAPVILDPLGVLCATGFVQKGVSYTTMGRPRE